MSVLSITFHATENVLKDWETYTNSTLKLLIDNFMDVNQYLLSDVDSGMINEGKNYNLLLIFDNESYREQFLANEMLNLEELITAEFGSEVMIFPTLLNPIVSKL